MRYSEFPFEKNNLAETQNSAPAVLPRCMPASTFGIISHIKDAIQFNSIGRPFCLWQKPKTKTNLSRWLNPPSSTLQFRPNN